MSQTQPLSQKSYQETPYEDQAWEVVGEVLDNTDFIPLQVPIIPRQQVTTDPMFADYGGTMKEGATEVEHQDPKKLAYAGGVKKKSRKEDEEKESRFLKLLPEDIERIKAEAFAAGKAAGIAEGKAGGDEKLGQMQQGLQEVINDIAVQITENLKKIEKEAVSLSIAISEKLVGHAVEINPEYVGIIVSQALAHAGSATIKKVRVSAQDMEFIEVVGLPAHLVETDKGWNFERDDSVRSGCVVETSAGEIDFRLDQAWERIKESVLKVIR